LISVMSHYVNSYYSTDMDKFYTVYLSVIIVGKPTCVIPRDLRHTPSMAAYKMIRLKFELACKSSILLSSTLTFWQGALSNITFIISAVFDVW